MALGSESDHRIGQASLCESGLIGKGKMAGSFDASLYLFNNARIRLEMFFPKNRNYLQGLLKWLTKIEY